MKIAHVMMQDPKDKLTHHDFLQIFLAMLFHYYLIRYSDFA